MTPSILEFFQLFWKWFKSNSKIFGIFPTFLEMIPNILEFFKLFWNWFKSNSKIFGIFPTLLEMIPILLEMIQNILEFFHLFWKWLTLKRYEIMILSMICHDLTWSDMFWHVLIWFCNIPNIMDSKMIGIAKGDIMMMKIKEVNTMTPRQNDLVVKNGITGNLMSLIFCNKYIYLWVEFKLVKTSSENYLTNPSIYNEFCSLWALQK